MLCAGINLRGMQLCWTLRLSRSQGRHHGSVGRDDAAGPLRALRHFEYRIQWPQDIWALILAGPPYSPARAIR